MALYLHTGSACAMTDPKIPTWVDYDMHDAAVFDQPNARLTTKVQSTNRVISAEGRGGSITRQDNDDSPDNNTAVTFHMGGGGGGGGSDIEYAVCVCKITFLPSTCGVHVLTQFGATYLGSNDL